MPFDGLCGIQGRYPGADGFSLRNAAALLNVSEDQVQAWLERGDLRDLSYEAVSAAYELPPSPCRRVVVVEGQGGASPTFATRFV